MSAANTKKKPVSKTRAYRSWNAMVYRCENKNCNSYRWYGLRGIKVCTRWKKFENFLADMGERPEGMTLDRIDSGGHYEPRNCRWATPLQQSENRRGTRLISFNGEQMPIRAWARKLGMDCRAVRDRLAKFPVSIALTMPKRGGRPVVAP